MQLHPWNKDFTWVDRPDTGLQYLSRKQLAQFNGQGFVVLPQVINNQTRQNLLAEIDPIEQAGGGSVLVDANGELARYAADELTFSCNLVQKSEVLSAFYRSDLFVKLTHDLLAKKCRLYWDQAVYKYPEKGGEFPWHQDNGYTFVSPQAYITCWLALEDAPQDAGCPWVMPGAHRAGTYVHQKQPYGLEITNYQQLQAEHGQCAAPAKAGDMVVFSSLTPHKTGPNTSDYIRKALIIQFIPDGAVRLENPDPISLNHPVLNQPMQQ
ncbi:hypothetical protein MNBD_ALPHA06-1593 [hydrothermal vent metagenome]|uniref:Phytanoyl-CoA dioxygenase family protein n=1 Tax=hydrothermal vent metagenome TaxID=652676 RepID=A0A3B0RZ14_9ZZZZ